jgi:hypothetical protein
MAHLIRVGEQHTGHARLKADAQRLDEVDRRSPPRVRVGTLNVATHVPESMRRESKTARAENMQTNQIQT